MGRLNYKTGLKRRFILFTAFYVLLITIIHFTLMYFGNSDVYEYNVSSLGRVFGESLVLGLLIMPLLYIATKRKVTEELSESYEMIDKSERRFRTTFENAAVGMAIVDNTGKLAEVNNRLALMLGYTHDELLGMRIADVTYPDDLEGNMDLYRQLLDGKVSSYQYEKRYVRKDGTICWGQVNASVLGICGSECLVAIIKDITEQKAAQDRVLKSLREKEVLLKEVHHRVKNNMQILSSLLTIHSNYLNAPDLERAFEDSIQRIKTMALVHEKIYQAEDYNNIDFNKFAEDLIRVHSHRYGVEITSEINVRLLNVNYAIPCGLITNELLSNAVRHAFEDGKQGRVDITLNAAGGGRCVLEVRDNGKGLPEPIFLHTRETLGLYLVKLLVAQIGGELEVRRNGGTAFRITFEHV